jgi:hypothetical protein
MTSTLTPLQLTAGAGLLQNQGLIINPVFANTVNQYNTSNLITPLIQSFNLINVVTPPVSDSTANLIKTIGSTTVPALGDTVSPTYTNIVLTGNTNTGFTNLLLTDAALYLGNGDLSKFVQAMDACEGYSSSGNDFINSALNSQNYLSNTFVGFNSMVSGGITDVNSNPELWGTDLLKLGSLWDMANLNELGSPLALLRQLSKLGGITPELSIAFASECVSLDVVINFKRPSNKVKDTDQKLMYSAMKKITGTTLDHVLQVFGVTTPNIETMADLLNPYKLFPNSFRTLAVTNVENVSQLIYLDSAGTVNPNLAVSLPETYLKSLA